MAAAKKVSRKGRVTQKNPGKYIKKQTNATTDINVSTQYLAVEGFEVSVMERIFERDKYKHNIRK